MFNSTLKLTKVVKPGERIDTLHIGANRNRMKGYINVLRMKDKDTHQVILFIPAFDMTSYGETPEKAEEMLRASIHLFFEDILSLTPGKMAVALAELGWKKDKLRNKDFSKVTVDVEGNLKDFNIVPDEVEHLALVS